MSVIFKAGIRDGHKAYDQHVADCRRSWHMGYVMGVYDPHGMRLNWFASVACADAPCGLDECAQDQIPYWPGNHVYLWLDLSLVPTEHLRDMPAPDASA
jgi:hypothetical protein